MEYSRHAGGCCGIGVIHDFDDAYIQDLDRCIEEHARAATGNNRILEAVLSERQLRPTEPTHRRLIRRDVVDAGGWPVVLASRGFRLAESFTNSNTGNNCYRFIRIGTLMEVDDPSRGFWPLAASVMNPPASTPPPPPPPPLPITIVLTEYQVVFVATGRHSAPFPTLGELTNAYPRARNYVRRDILSSGEVTLSQPERIPR